MIDVKSIVREGVPLRYINNDIGVKGGDRIYFAQGEFNQNVQAIPQESFRGRHMYFPRRSEVEEIILSLNEISGLPIPDAFYRSLNVHLVPGMLYHGGMTVPSRVIRQQIFIGAMSVPYTAETLHMTLFHALGNALWNYLDYWVWGSLGPPMDDDGDGVDFAEKNEYRRLRHFPYKSDVRTGNRQQRDLFYIAAEDFRYLCGTAEARRGEWFITADVIDPPNPEVINFWMKEFARGSNERTPQAQSA